MANIFRTASLWLKIAIVCCFIGLVLFVIAFATTSWTVRSSSYNRRSDHFGLWQYTQCGHNGCRTSTYSGLNDYHRAIQAMECLGLIGFGLATITLFLYLCADSFRRRDFLQAATVFTFLGLLFACIGFAIFGSKDNQENHHTGNIGWSMGLGIAGAALYGIALVMLILQLVR